MRTAHFGRVILIVVALSLIVTAPLLANAGVGFFYGNILHILFLNLLIGWLEAFFLRRVFKIPVRYGIVILANYISSLVGFVVFFLGGMGLEGGIVNLILLLCLLIVTIVVEYPIFIRSVQQQTSGTPRVTLAQTSAAQCLSYALLLPIYLITFDSGRLPAAKMVELDLENLASQAFQYRMRTRSAGGGGGSYEAFVLPEWRGGFRLSGTVTKDSIRFVMMSADGLRKLATVTVNSYGRAYGEQYWVSDDEDATRQKLTYWLNDLVDEARSFRLRPRSVGSANGTYVGFKIPDRLRETSEGRYSAIVTPDSVVFIGVSTDTTVPHLRLVVDSTGKRRIFEPQK